MGRYSDDRLSLAQEVRDTLKTRGHWVPEDWAGPDLIAAIGMALEKSDLQNKELLKLVRRAEDALGPDRTASDRRETLMILGKFLSDLKSNENTVSVCLPCGCDGRGVTQKGNHCPVHK